MIAQAGRDVLVGPEAEESLVGIVLATAPLLVMPALALAKRRTGRHLGSATLVADGGWARD
ncbi:MAG TPA: hypothetical protein VG034_25605 [Acidimicrobiia bacterium]|nr:hypothetical protein [Acidimicrobiia bacterium]